MGSRKTGNVKFKPGEPGRLQQFYVVPEMYCPPAGYTCIEVPLSMVEDVVEYFMDEPPVGTIVRAKIVDGTEAAVSCVFQHVLGDIWLRVGSVSHYKWAQLIEVEEPEIIFQPGVDPHETCG